MKKMKKIMTLLITLAMVMSMAVPAFADDTPADTDVEMPIAPAPAELTKSQVKAITPKNVKAASYSYTKIKLTWDKIEGVDGYKVYRAISKGGKYSLVKTTTSANTLSYINTGRTTGKTYYYKVRGYKKIGRTTYYTKYSAVTSTYARPNKVVITKVNCISEWKVRIYWNKVAGATGYQVYRSKKGADNWKLYKTVSNKYSYATNFLEGDTDFTTWEWKVRAYRTVNGKKVYGYFSAPKEYVPDWTIDEIYEELWKYGESLKFPLYEYANPDGSDNENGEVIVPKKDGSTYHFKNIKGWSDSLWGYEAYVYTNSKNGNTKIPADFIAATPDNMSWDVAWPNRISYYDTKDSILKRLKPILKAELEDIHRSNPLYWANANIEGVGGPNDEDEYWNGADLFSVYIEKDRNSYKIWSLW